jgi:branched-chain amino acid transport system permease protein
LPALSAARLTLLALLLAVAACGGLDVEQARLCERLIPALEDPGASFVTTARETDPAASHAVLIHYQLHATHTAPAAERWISCRFAGGGFAEDRLRLTGVVTSQDGPLSDITVFLLRRYWLGLYEGQTGAASAPPPRERLLYALQLAVNALNLGCLYGLLALGYTLVYGIARRINLAFGEIAMVGAYTTFVAVTALALLGAGTLPLALLAVLALVALVGAVHGLITERLVFRPLYDEPSQAPLIATVGLALFLQEYLRLSQGAADRWIQPVFSEAHRLAGTATGFTVTISTSQLLILALTAVLYLALWRLMTRTRFGRAARACADDLGMAALCGVAVPRIMAQTFTLGSACAAAAGFVILLRYGGVRFTDGFLLGFKALTAAILGGIGSLPGAMLGGLLIGTLETFWAGYLTLAYKDVAVFALLAAVLVWRPQGLFGDAVRLANDRFRPVP